MEVLSVAHLDMAGCVNNLACIDSILRHSVCADRLMSHAHGRPRASRKAEPESVGGQDAPSGAAAGADHSAELVDI
jgi:hypothetical protein